MTYISNRIDSLGNYKLPEILKSENPEQELDRLMEKLLKGKSGEEREEFLDQLSEDLRDYKKQLRTKKKEINQENSQDLDFSSYIQNKIKKDQLGSSSRRGHSDLDKLTELEKFLPKVLSSARDTVRDFKKRNMDLTSEPNSMFDVSKILSTLSDDPSDIELNTVNVRLAFRGKNREMTERDYLAGVTDNQSTTGVVHTDVNEDGVKNYDDILAAREKFEAEKDPSGSILFWQGDIPEIVAYNAAADTLVVRISDDKKSGYVNLHPVSGSQIRFSRPFSEDELDLLEAKLPPHLLQSLFGGHEVTKSAFSDIVDQIEPEVMDRLKAIPHYAEVQAGSEGLSSPLASAYQSVIDEIYKSVDDPQISDEATLNGIQKKLSVLSTSGRQEVWSEVISQLASYEKAGLTNIISKNITDIQKSMGIKADMKVSELAALPAKTKATLLFMESFTGVQGLLGGRNLWNEAFGQPYEGEVSPEDQEAGITYFTQGPWMNDDLGDILTEYVKFATKLPSDLDHQTAINNVLEAYERFNNGQYKDPEKS